MHLNRDMHLICRSSSSQSPCGSATPWVFHIRLDNFRISHGDSAPTISTFGQVFHDFSHYIQLYPMKPLDISRNPKYIPISWVFVPYLSQPNLSKLPKSRDIFGTEVDRGDESGHPGHPTSSMVTLFLGF